MDKYYLNNTTLYKITHTNNPQYFGYYTHQWRYSPIWNNNDVKRNSVEISTEEAKQLYPEAFK